MKTSYKNHTILTEAIKKSETVGWALTLEILAEGKRVVAPIQLGEDLVFATEALAHRAGIILARYWIDGGGPQ